MKDLSYLHGGANKRHHSNNILNNSPITVCALAFFHACT